MAQLVDAFGLEPKFWEFESPWADKNWGYDGNGIHSGIRIRPARDVGSNPTSPT